MFDFKRKTIEAFREEIARHIGKEVILSDGQKAIIHSVSENGDHYISRMARIGFKEINGEFDWDKSMGVKAYGFIVTIKQKNGDAIQEEKIIVPYEMKDERMTLKHNQPISILK